MLTARETVMQDEMLFSRQSDAFRDFHARSDRGGGSAKAAALLKWCAKLFLHDRARVNKTAGNLNVLLGPCFSQKCGKSHHKTFSVFLSYNAEMHMCLSASLDAPTTVQQYAMHTKTVTVAGFFNDLRIFGHSRATNFLDDYNTANSIGLGLDFNTLSGLMCTCKKLQLM